MAKTEAQEAPTMQMPKPQKEHEWLQRLVGEWVFEGEAKMGPGKDWDKFSGEETTKMLGEMWMISESKMPSPDGTATNVTTIGFDSGKKRFVGTFISSMMPVLWVYEGELDESEKKLPLYSEGPSMTGAGKTATFRDSIEIIDDDHRTLTSEMKMDDDKWLKVMEMRYTRKK